MPYVTEWISTDRKTIVILRPIVVNLLKRNRQRYSFQPERGGILLGKRRGKHIEVVAATKPMRTDRGSRYRFYRGSAGHAEAAIHAWQSKGQTIDYVGEWHTHPQELPTPSSIDRFEWAKLATSRTDALVVVVVGIKVLHVEIIKSRQQIVLQPVLDDPASPPKMENSLSAASKSVTDSEEVY